jgi:hypothetical protein
MRPEYITPEEEMNKLSEEEILEAWKKINEKKKEEDRKLINAYSGFNWNLKCG